MRSACPTLYALGITSLILATSCGNDERLVHPGGDAAGAAGSPALRPDLIVFTGPVVVGRGQVDFLVEGGTVVAFTPDLIPVAAERVDLTGYFVCPALVDSHVHLTYYPVSETLAHNGVLGAVDLAAPLATLDAFDPWVSLVRSGPMVTQLMGYPTQSWGSNGYGYEVDDAQAAADATRELIERGAEVIKFPLAGEPSLTDDQIEQIVRAAHARERLVIVHALGSASAERAAALGADVLAHTPTEALEDSVVEAWSGRTVISTLAAFGGSDTAVDNLRRLRAAGTRVLYGTDLGNLRTPGVSSSELALLAATGLDGHAIVESMTTQAADFWHLDVGRLEEGSPANFIVLGQDPETNPQSLTTPIAVYRRGEQL